MTKAQALALSNALVGNKLPHRIIYALDNTGADLWSAQLDTTRTYSGAELTTLTNYCATNSLTLSVILSQMGVT